MTIDMTTVASSAVVAVIISTTQLIAHRYINRILDRVDSNIVKKDKPKK